MDFLQIAGHHPELTCKSPRFVGLPTAGLRFLLQFQALFAPMRFKHHKDERLPSNSPPLDDGHPRLGMTQSSLLFRSDLRKVAMGGQYQHYKSCAHLSLLPALDRNVKVYVYMRSDLCKCQHLAKPTELTTVRFIFRPFQLG